MRCRLARNCLVWIPGRTSVVWRDEHGSASANRRTSAMRSAARLFQLRSLLSNIAQAMSCLNWVAQPLQCFRRSLRSATRQPDRARATHWRRNDDIPGALVSSAVADRRVMFRRLHGAAASSGEDPVLTSRQLSLRGMDALHQGRWDDAESLFKSAIALHPADERSHRQYAEVLWRRGERDAAIREMGRR